MQTPLKRSKKYSQPRQMLLLQTVMLTMQSPIKRSKKTLVVSDVTPLSLGIKVAGDAMDIVI